MWLQKNWNVSSWCCSCSMYGSGMYVFEPTPKHTLSISTITSLSVHQLPLELSQSFVKNIDGSYSRFRCPDPPPEPELPEGHRTDRPQAIRPMELRTFLKVGKWLFWLLFFLATIAPISQSSQLYLHSCICLQEQAQQIRRKPVHL